MTGGWISAGSDFEGGVLGDSRLRWAVAAVMMARRRVSGEIEDWGFVLRRLCCDKV